MTLRIILLAAAALTFTACNLSDDGSGVLPDPSDSGNNSTVPDSGMDSGGENDAGTEVDSGAPDMNVGDPCDDLSCANGTCVTDGMTANCECDDGYAGDLCDVCEDGLQDNDGDGVCEADCSTSALDCGEAFCDDTGGTAVCVCPTGLALDPGALTCDLSGTFGGNTFQESEGQWTTEGNGMFDPNYVGSDGQQGGFVVPYGATCDPGGTGISQTIEIADKATYGEAIFYVRAAITPCQDFFCDTSGDIYISIGSVFYTLPLPNRDTRETTIELETCLPDTLYGNGPTEVRIWSQAPDSFDCTQTNRVATLDAIEEVSVRRPATAGTCATGLSVTGDFEGLGLMTGDPIPEWSTVSSNLASTRIVTSLGNSAAELAVNNPCNNASMSTNVVIPAPANRNDGMALKYFQDIQPNDNRLAVRIAGETFRFAGADNQPQASICVPYNKIGTASALSFGMTVGGACANVVNHVTLIDDVRFEADPNCAALNRLSNGGFDEPLSVGWNFAANFPNNSSTYASIARTDENGDFYTTMGIAGGCSSSFLNQTINAANSEANAVQVRYRYSYGANTAQTNATISMSSEGNVASNSAFFGRSANWTTGIFCMPDAPEIPVDMSIRLSSQSGSCLSGHARDTLDIDDVEMVNDPNCAP